MRNKRARPKKTTDTNSLYYSCPLLSFCLLVATSDVLMYDVLMHSCGPLLPSFKSLLAHCLPCICKLLIWISLVANLMECLVWWAARVGWHFSLGTLLLNADQTCNESIVCSD
jgi:hypothetical protein